MSNIPTHPMMPSLPSVASFGMPLTPTLADYYGTGPGQVPIHHTPSDPSGITLDGSGLVTASVNRGGAGAVFDLSQVDSGSAPIITGGAFDFGNTVGKRLAFNNAVDLNGVHLVAAVFMGGANSRDIHVCGSSLSSRIFAYRNSASAIRWRDWMLTRIEATVSTTVSAWHIGEVRRVAGTVTLYWDGVAVTTGPGGSGSALASLLGAVNGSSIPAKQIGDFASVICASGYTPADPEPSVLLARQTLAEQYGVTL